MQGAHYLAKLQEEQRIFRGNKNVHNLPDIFHYWSNAYVLPKLEAVGIRGSQELFSDSLAMLCEREPERDLRFISIGSGNCDLEIDLAERLLAAGHSRFVIDCLDLNETMLERGRKAAADRGIGHLDCVAADFNHWEPKREYDAVIAIQALHHVVNLEGLFAAIRRCLRPRGLFVVSDMIGRNGHMRWPEALEIVYEFWRKLPPSYRYNHQLLRYEEMFVDWDCSVEGFEGIRAQDILRLLVDNFHFERFVAFGNAIDPFVERSFGHNFDASAAWDQGFIDAVHLRDEQEMHRGALTPTHMFAVLQKEAERPTLCIEPMRPEFCVRKADARTTPAAEVQDPYAWGSWPHPAEPELQFVARQLGDSETRARQLSSDYNKLVAAFEERTSWALNLNAELEALAKRVTELDRELKERTEWALSLNRELERRGIRNRVKNLLGRS